MVGRIWAKLSDFYADIYVTHPANFIETTVLVQEIQQFKLNSSLFKWLYSYTLNIDE